MTRAFLRQWAHTWFVLGVWVGGYVALNLGSVIRAWIEVWVHGGISI